MAHEPRHVLITGGAGYIGSVLTRRLLERGDRVIVYDNFFYGREPLVEVADHDHLELVEGDLREEGQLRALLEQRALDAVVHLAAISNDPSSKLDPELTEQVNGVACARLMRQAKRAGVPRFLYASSASVYGIKDVEDVVEELPLEPITQYARCKADGEEVLNGLVDEEFCGVSVRAATVCGWSPRLRLDLTINILTMHALRHGRIRVFGGDQLRPNVHIQDLVDFYAMLLDAPREAIQGQAFNVSRANASVMELAHMIREALGERDVEIVTVPTDDHRSYHLSAAKAERALGYRPTRPLTLAVEELAGALARGELDDPDDPVHRNVELMRARPAFWKMTERDDG